MKNQISKGSGRGLHFALYAGFMAAASILGFSKAVVLAAVLEPEQFGYLAIAEIVVTYGIYACSWGLVHGLRREVPLLIGSGETATVTKVLGSATGALGATCLVSILLYLAVLRWVLGLEGIPFKVGVLAGLLSALNVFFFFGTLQLAGYERFVAFSAYSALKSGAVLVLAVALGHAYGVVGALSGEAVGFIVVVLGLGTLGKLFPKPRWDESLRTLRQVYSIGLPLVGQGVMRSLSANLDKVLLALSIGPAGLGIYNFALLQVSAVLVLVNLLGLYLGPKLYRAYGRTGDVAEGRRLLARIILGFTVVAIALYPLFERVVDWGVPRYFSRYAHALDLIKLLYFGAVLHFVTLYELILVALGRVYLYLALTGAMAVAFGVVYATLAWLEVPLIAYGLAYVLVRGVATIVTLWMTARADPVVRAQA